jgi:GWxTD domain-containing protein
MKYIPLYLIILFIIKACAPSSNSSVKTNGFSTKKLLPNHVIYHKSEDSSYVYSQINTSQLLYTRINQSYPFKALVEIEIIVFQNNIGIDTLRNIFTDMDNNQDSKIILAKTAVALGEGTNYWLEINSKDAAKKDIITQNIIVEKLISSSTDYILVVDDVTQLPITNNTVKPGQQLSLISDFYTNNILVSFLETNFELAAAPYTANSNVRIRFDSQTEEVFFKKDNKWSFQTPNNTGIIKIGSVSGINATTHLTILPASHPQLRNYESMTEVLRYITTNNEYNKIIKSANKREAFESFWLSCTRTKEKAKTLINEFYLRAEEANVHFTSYKEGWKTDKGIIHIVYGKPQQVYSNGNSETWLYGDETNPLSLNFTFDKQNNPYSNNDFILRRSPTYQSSWYVAIERWRDGRIYN